MNWREKANDLVEKVKKYCQDEEGWKVAKRTKDASVWYKSSPEWNGHIYKAESTMQSSPEVVYSYLEPNPDGPRNKWDKAVKEVEVIETIDKDLGVVRTITHSAVGGLISSRDFVDVVIKLDNNDYIATCGVAADHPGCPPSSSYVRGSNYPCALICYRVPGEPDKTRVVSLTQSELGGMLPRSLIDSAMPSNQVDFMTSLRKALQDGGHWKDAA